jgi:uncharacterized repeat protein (TIGR01451 family)
MIVRRFGLLLIFVVALLALFSGSATLQAQTIVQPAGVDSPDATLAAQLAAQIDAQGAVPLIVELNLPDYRPEAFADVQAAAAQETAIANAQNAVLARLAGHEVTNIKTYEYLPFVALTIYSRDTLDALFADPDVVRIHEDKPVPPALADSVPLVRADIGHTIFYRGQGQTVAILDTGVDKNHPNLAGKVVSEACYSTTNSLLGASSLCPGGASSSVANNSGLHCTNIGSCDHGTHVAAIAAGVAPGANLISIQVFTRMTDFGIVRPCNSAGRTSPCVLTFPSDYIAGLNRVFALRNTFTIASANMSLGGADIFPLPCDIDPTKIPIDLLRAVNIATVIAAGNGSQRNAMGSPACVSTAISVGNTTKNNQVAASSNVNLFTTLWAPGSSILAAVPPAFAVNANNPVAFKSGTSMAAPHVAGAVAVLKHASPNATVSQIINALTTNTSPLITDQRSGGFVTKRRLDVYNSLCALITCDNDDFRFISLGQTLAGSVNPANDRDHYFFNGVAGQRVNIRMNRTSGTVDPYLEFFDPNGNRVAFNNNGGGGVNALISGYTLQQTGRYLILARGANAATGNYTLSLESAPFLLIALNPAPQINSLNPASATGTLFGSDFWVAIHGANFLPTSEVRWNGELRTMFFSSSTLIYIRVQGSDLGLPWPRLAFITVRNPTPGGGTSNSMPFNITFPFLGESELVLPAPGSVVTTGISTTFVISWTHPDDSWRTMQNMDLRLRNAVDGSVMASIRVVEREGETSVYRLLNGLENAQSFDEDEQPIEGLPGIDLDLVITDTITLHLADSRFSGSGRTAIMSPTVTFGPDAVGVYNIEFRVDNPDGEIQDDDVLGQITIVPQECPFAVTGVTLSGPDTVIANTDYTYTAEIAPLNATGPITVTWAPEPASGQGTTTAVYNWPTAGEQFVFVGVENCGSFAGGVKPVRIRTTENPDLAINKSGPATAVAGEAITYTLTITNSGALTATNLVVLDEVPAGATYSDGGSLVGDTVRWDLAELAGFGGVAQVSYSVSVNATITNSDYSVSASGGFNATGSEPVVTRLVDARSSANPLAAASLQTAGLEIIVPEGSVFDETVFALDELDEPTYPLPEGLRYAGLAFRLGAYQQNRLAPDLQLGEAISMTVSIPLTAAGASSQMPELYYWDGSAWTQEALTCTPSAEPSQLACVYAGGMLTQFALLAAESQQDVAGVALSASPSSATAAVGTNVSYRLTLTNTGTTSDTFTIGVSGEWSATPSTSSAGPLASGASTVFTVTVAIPPGAGDGESDATTVTVISQQDATVQQMTTLTTTAQRPSVQEPDRLFLPLIQQAGGSVQNAQITGIGVEGDRYVVSFTTTGFAPQLPGQHVHFFFNTVSPEQAGAPGPGAWHVHGSLAPYSGITVAERPAGASQLCVLIANPDHSVQLDTGNCYNLP